MDLGKELYTKEEVGQLLEAFRQELLQEGRADLEESNISHQRGDVACPCTTDVDSLFKAVFDTVLDAIFIINESGHIEIINPAACSMFGYGQNELLGADITRIMTEEIAGEHGQFMQQYLQGGEPKIIGVSGREFPALRKDGTVFPIEIAITHVEISGRIYFVGVIHDISRRMEQEEELRNARDEALKSVRVKSDILTNFSHEIRTPMNGIIGCTELLKETSLDEEQRSYINIVLESANGLLILLNDLVDLSRLETGKIRISKEPFEPRHLFESVCSLFQSQAGEKALQLSCNVDADIPEILIGDEGHLRQLLVNLVQNALKFTSKGTVQLGVDVLSSSEDAVLAEFYVEDTGIGIAPDEQEKIFSNFVQGEHAKATMSGGLGLGLSICRHLVNHMDGNIFVQSEPGKGSRFYFRVPLLFQEQG